MLPAAKHVLVGAAYGAAAGAILSAGGYYMKTTRGAPVELGVSAPHVERDRELKGVLLNFAPLRKASQRTDTLYVTLVSACDLVVRAELQKAKGAMQMKANRANAQAIATARMLCREAAKSPGCKDAAFLAMREIESLEGILQNHLHNVMLG
tara:strand:+ start:1888 stop:2343 length:456 start_codon:yes stop_codon:yes gene_type:complete